MLDLSAPASYTLFTLEDPHRVVVDLERIDSEPSAIKVPAGTGAVKAVRLGARGPAGLRVGQPTSLADSAATVCGLKPSPVIR